MSGTGTVAHRTVETAKQRVGAVRGRAQRTLVWKIWERMLEAEFVDRSVALAGKAFVSFFPLIIVVAAFMPSGIRASIFSTVEHRVGLSGDALTLAKKAFVSSKDLRDATSFLGLVLTIFYASSFTTALQRVYLRTWRRPPTSRVGPYVRGLLWTLLFLTYAAMLGGIRALLSGAVGTGVLVAVALAGAVGLWWLTAWLMLGGQVRLRVVFPSGLVTGVALSLYAVSANVWMPETVRRNQAQFGFFGVALALVTWFSGAAICVLIGACTGPILAEDRGPIGRLVRGGTETLLVDGAAPFLPPPNRPVRLADAFRSTDDEPTKPDNPPAPTG
jgi:membrane protein